MATSGDGPISAPEPPSDEGRARAVRAQHENSDEPISERLLRHALRVRFYSSATAGVAILVVLILLISVNARTVKIDWVVGSSHASLIWIVLAATILGWLLGIATSIFFRHRTRRRQT